VVEQKQFKEGIEGNLGKTNQYRTVQATLFLCEWFS